MSGYNSNLYNNVARNMERNNNQNSNIIDSNGLQGAILVGTAIVLSNAANGESFEKALLQSVVAGMLVGAKDAFKDIARQEKYGNIAANAVGYGALMGGTAAVYASAKVGGLKSPDAILAAVGGSVIGAALTAGGVKLANKASSFVEKLGSADENQQSIDRWM